MKRRPGLVEPMLRFQPEDAGLVPQVEWEVKPDTSLPRSACRLEAMDGEWYADFGAALAALRAALPRKVEQDPIATAED